MNVVASRPRLGRGLKSLIAQPVAVFSPASPAPPAPGNGDRLAEIDLALIDPNPHQPRAAIDPSVLLLVENVRLVSSTMLPADPSRWSCGLPAVPLVIFTVLGPMPSAPLWVMSRMPWLISTSERPKLLV